MGLIVIGFGEIFVYILEGKDGVMLFDGLLVIFMVLREV